METVEIVVEETQPESQKPSKETITPLGWTIFFLSVRLAPMLLIYLTRMHYG
jgi:hypothetical protein